MIFQDWSYKRVDFQVRILHDPSQIGANNNVKGLKIKGGLHQKPQKLDWVATLAPIRPPPKSPPWGNIFPSLSSFLCIYAFIHTLRTMYKISMW